MQYRPRFTEVEARPINDGDSMMVELDPPLYLIVEFNVFEALFEPARGRQKQAKTGPRSHNGKKPPRAAKTIWELMQEALGQGPKTSAELIQYVASKGKITTDMTVFSILGNKRRAGLLQSPEECGQQRGGTWKLTGGHS